MSVESILAGLDEQIPPAIIAEGICAAEEGQINLPVIVDGAEFVARGIPEPPELVKGILHRGTKGVIGGGSKSFKTWCLLDLGISVSRGIRWWGFKTSTGRVMFINLELPDFAMQKRLISLCNNKSVEPASLQDNLFLWNLRGHAADFSKLRDTIIAAVLKHNIDLVIIDPYYKVLGARDENSARDISLLHNEFERVTVETGAAVVWGAHFAKGSAAQKESLDRISGSGVFVRDPDTVITLTRHATEGAYSVEPTLRNFPPVKSFAVKWKPPLMVRDDGLNPADLHQPARRHSAKTNTRPTTEQFVGMLPEKFKYHPREAMLTTAEIQVEFVNNGWDKNQVAAMRDELERRGLVAVVAAAHNAKLICRPEVGAAYESERQKSDTTGRAGRAPRHK